jgi:hypothetical protein
MKIVARMAALVAFALGLMSLLVYGGDKPKWVGGPHYFSSMAAKSLPEKPKNPISETEAKRPDREGAYYVAYFDERGNLLSLEKMFRGNSIARSTYRYDERGHLQTGELSEPDGPTLLYRADAAGNLTRVK